MADKDMDNQKSTGWGRMDHDDVRESHRGKFEQRPDWVSKKA